MSSRQELPTSLDFFPTPPWATRAFIRHMLQPLAGDLSRASAWDPAAGEGHMVGPLAEVFDVVHASDVHDYGRGYPVGSFIGQGIGQGLDVVPAPAHVDWIITNPPFNAATEFAERAIADAWRGVAFLVRPQWLATIERYDLFMRHRPALIAQYVERVPMVRGRWDPAASTATDYCWVVWDRAHAGRTVYDWIPPGQRAALEHKSDRSVYAAAPSTQEPQTVPLSAQPELAL